jgi:hypothetical protein
MGQCGQTTVNQAFQGDNKKITNKNVSWIRLKIGDPPQPCVNHCSFNENCCFWAACTSISNTLIWSHGDVDIDDHHHLMITIIDVISPSTLSPSKTSGFQEDTNIGKPNIGKPATSSKCL